VIKLAKAISEVTALSIYREAGKTIPALKTALDSLAKLPASKAKKKPSEGKNEPPEAKTQLNELLKKICLAAQGMGDSIYLEPNELVVFAQFLIIACQDDRDSIKLLAALKQNPDEFRKLNTEVINSFLADSKKTVPKLFTHLQKTRNPDSGVQAYVQIPVNDSTWVTVAQTETRRVSMPNIEIYQRWFWEPTVIVSTISVQWIEVIRSNLTLDWFWINSTGRQLPLPQTRVPLSIDALSHQLLFENDDGSYVSITPLTTVGAISVLASSNSSKLLGRRSHTVQYGGKKKSINIAAIMMDRSGSIRHPINVPWIPPRTPVETLMANHKEPRKLISRQILSEKDTELLFAPHVESATNKARQSRLYALLEPLLERSCSNLVQWRDFMISQYGNHTLSDGSTSFVKWAFNASDLSNSEACELADSVLGLTLPNYRTRDFQRWRELVDLTQAWLGAV
jgi:hypothetical protein